MKKFVVVLAVVVFGLFVFTSCNIPDEINKKYEIKQNNTKTGHENAGNGGVDDDDEETGNK